jgi:hypothetical protein
MGEYLTLIERVLNHLPEDAAYGVSASLATGDLHLSVNQEHIETALSVMAMDPTPSMAWPMEHDPQYEHVRWIGPVDGISVILGTWRPVAAQDPAAADPEDVMADAANTTAGAEGTTVDIENPDSAENSAAGVDVGAAR